MATSLPPSQAPQVTAPEPRPDVARPRRLRRSADHDGDGILRHAPLFALVTAFGVLYLIVAWLQPVPLVLPDELTYAHIARSLAHGDGTAWRGDPAGLRASLYSFALVPSWLFFSGLDAYQAAKVESTVISCLLAVPVWLLARTFLSRGLSTLVVALSLAGSWMGETGSLLNESLALPCAIASLALTIDAVRRSSTRNLWLALAFALLAAWSRLQLVVLVPCILVALAADIARYGSAWRSRARHHAPQLIVLSAVVAVGAIVVLVLGSSTLGTYAGIAHYRPDLKSVAGATGRELLELGAQCGVVPLALLFVLAVNRRAWRHEVVGPMLCVLVPAVVLLAVQSGFFMAGYDAFWGIQRYMSYVAPLLVLFAVTTFALTDLVRRRTLLATAIVSMSVLLTPEVTVRGEQRAAGMTTDIATALVPSTSTGVALAVMALLVIAVAAAARGRRPAGPSRRSGIAIGTALLVVLLAQTGMSLHWQQNIANGFRDRIFGPELTWLQDHGQGPVAMLVVSDVPFEYPMIDFFNDNIQQLYAPQGWAGDREMVPGRVCSWSAADDGALQLSRGCPLTTRQLYVDDPMGRLHFQQETEVSRSPDYGRVTRVSGRPRLLSKVILPCPRIGPLYTGDYLLTDVDASYACAPQVLTDLWLDAPAHLAIVLQGAPVDAHVTAVGERRHDVPPGRTTTIRVAVGAGHQQVPLDLDWAAHDPELPSVLDVRLERDGRSTSLL
jgi:hypothetical protein